MKRLEVVSLVLVIYTVCLITPVSANTKLSISEKIAKYGLNNVVATYTTSFDGKEKNRVQNIKLAAKQVDGTLLMPGEVFSFNEVVGPRTKKRGFKEAPEIVDGELVPGVGGGICQLSSTLYNATLLSNLEIVERKNHSQPVDYIPLGRGATVYYNWIDYKFRNNTSDPLLILARLRGEQLTVSVLARHLHEQVKITTSTSKILKPKVIEKLDQDLKLGTSKVFQHGKKGFKVIVKKLLFREGKLINEEVISKDIYSPQPRIIKYNAKE
ncbi:hypothetical protein JCM16358_17090 [Halanaerocella petrolearia]